MQMYKPFQFLTENECDEIITYAEKEKQLPGNTLGKDKNPVRSNRIVWYKNAERWKDWISMFNGIENKIDWIQDPQISFYSPGEKYDWHVDTWPKYRTHIRYFTLTCELQTAPDAGFQIEGFTFDPLKKGQAIIFKPQDRHRATTPSDGTRISFTIWAMALNPEKVDR